MQVNLGSLPNRGSVFLFAKTFTLITVPRMSDPEGTDVSHAWSLKYVQSAPCSVEA